MTSLAGMRYDYINVKGFHKTLRHLFQILPTPLRIFFLNLSSLPSVNSLTSYWEYELWKQFSGILVLI